MRNLFYILCFLTFGFTPLYSQVSFDEDSLLISFSYTGDTILEILMTNTGTTDMNLYWKLEKPHFNASWQTQICDFNNCFGFNKDKSSPNIPNILFAGTTGLFTVHVYPHSVQDSAVMVYKLFDENTFTNIVDTLPIIIYTNAVSTDNIENHNLAIFPNPATDYFQFSDINEIGRVEIFDLIGTKVRSYETSRDIYPVNDLKGGIYVVRAFNSGGKLSKVYKLEIL